MEIGLYSFAELFPRPGSAGLADPRRRLRDLLEEIELADQVGLDVFGVGEHHRPDFAVSAPAIVLAAAAERTTRIRLTSAVSVLGSDDPVRVYQQFSTLDLLSGGRAEIMAGRGSFVESFPLFGYDLRDYDRLFAERLELLLRVREREVASWHGETRPAIDGCGVYPRALQEPLPVWVAVGGSPESAYRTGALGLPMALAIIGGLPERFVPFAELHRRGAREAGLPETPRLSINAHGYVADSSQAALGDSWDGVRHAMNLIGRERGWSPFTRDQFEASATLRGAWFTGSPQQVAEKILWQHELFGHDRFLVKLTTGALPHDRVLRSIELLGTEVAPVVRDEVVRRRAAA